MGEGGGRIQERPTNNQLSRQMGIHALNKGKRAEREVVAILQPIVAKLYREANIHPPKMQRNTIQSDDGGCDLVGLEWLSLEVKHQEDFSLSAWWEQTVRQAYKGGKVRTPVLWYKRNNVAWRVRMPGIAGGTQDVAWCGCVVDISMEDFLKYLDARIRAALLLTP